MRNYLNKSIMNDDFKNEKWKMTSEIWLARKYRF